jgi:hypothetical protein
MFASQLKGAAYHSVQVHGMILGPRRPMAILYNKNG